MVWLTTVHIRRSDKLSLCLPIVVPIQLTLLAIVLYFLLFKILLFGTLYFMMLVVYDLNENLAPAAPNLVHFF
jgi:hypothetical protein